MSDIPENLQLIQVEEASYKAAVSEATLTKMGGSINALVKNGPESIGTIIESVLTEAQFQSIRGVQWVRMSGQDITGSDLEALTGISTLPDKVGTLGFSRQANAAETNLNDFQSSENLSHVHQQKAWDGVNALPDDPDHMPPLFTTHDQGGTTVPFKSSAIPISYGSLITLPPYPLNTVATGTTESRPVNFSHNFFIKINN